MFPHFKASSSSWRQHVDFGRRHLTDNVHDAMAWHWMTRECRWGHCGSRPCRGNQEHQCPFPCSWEWIWISLENSHRFSWQMVMCELVQEDHGWMCLLCYLYLRFKAMPWKQRASMSLSLCWNAHWMCVCVCVCVSSWLCPYTTSWPSQCSEQIMRWWWREWGMTSL